MKISVYVAGLASLAVLLLLKSGVSHKAIVVLATVAALMAIPLYFGTRNRNQPPSVTESVLAHLWVWFRRGLGLIVGVPCVVGGIYAVFSPSRNPAKFPWYGCILLTLVGFFILYLGFVGQGVNRHAFRDDIELHRENKRRYKWWF